MPIYEYRCQECDHHFEILQRLGDGPEGLACAGCGAAGRLEKMFSTFASAATEGSMAAAPMGGGCCQGTST